MTNTHGTPPAGELAHANATDAEVVRAIRARVEPVRAVPAAQVDDALRQLDALAAAGPPAPEDVAAVIAGALK